MISFIVTVVDIVENTGLRLGEPRAQLFERVIAARFHGKLPVCHHSLVAGQKGSIASSPDSLFSRFKITALKSQELLFELLIFFFIIHRFCAHQNLPFLSTDALDSLQGFK